MLESVRVPEPMKPLFEQAEQYVGKLFDVDLAARLREATAATACRRKAWSAIPPIDLEDRAKVEGLRAAFRAATQAAS
jgi:hypothetical protein